MTTMPKSGPMDFLFEEDSAPDWAPPANSNVPSATIGRPVRTRPISNPRMDWSPEAEARRRFGITGVIISVHNGRKGHFYGVLHDFEPKMAYYDPEELEVLTP